MKRIALLAPSISQNYGTVLQAFALDQYINKHPEISAEYIRYNYYTPALFSKILFLIFHPIFAFDRVMQKFKTRYDLNYDYLSQESYISIIKKNKKFCLDHIHYSECLFTNRTISKVNNLYDCFIVGSDQTWSPDQLWSRFPFSINSIYYLGFVKDDQKKNSYAPSIGTDSISKAYASFLKKRLNNFNHISCRDEKNSITLSDLLHREVENVIDPTLLFGSDFWSQFESEIQNISEKYILCYILGEKDCILQYSYMLGAYFKLPVFVIMTRPKYLHEKNVLKSVGVNEFIWLIHHASYVVTDSFHASLFSIIFNVQFFIFNKHSNSLNLDNGRIEGMINLFHVKDHFINDSQMSIPNDIDFETVNILVDSLREKSMDYLNRIIL